jgi:transposase
VRPERIPLAEVAEIVANWPTARGYTTHIAVKYNVPVPTARRWVAETRRRGLLAPGGPHPCPTCKGTGVRTWGYR